MQTIETFTLQLLISMDALRRDVVSDGAAYRAIFSWLLAVIQRYIEGGGGGRDVAVDFQGVALECSFCARPPQQSPLTL